jgi:hypothetical protein
MDVLKPRVLPIGSDDRQRFRRLAVLAPVLIECAGKVYEGEVRNISTGGALVRVEGALAPDQHLSISIAGGAPLQAVAVRLSGAGLGIAFREEAACINQVIDDLLSGRSGSEGRAHPRRLVLLGGALVVGARKTECTVQNISFGGAGLRCDAALQTNDSFKLDIGRYGTLPAHFVRAGASSLGCMFEAEPAEVQRILGGLLIERKG